MRAIRSGGLGVACWTLPGGVGFGFESVDLMPDFNLLHYPTLDRQESLRRQWRSGWVGVVLGAMLAGSAVPWWLWQTDHLQQSLQVLQARLAERKRQTEWRQQQRLQDQADRQQLTQLSQLQSQQQAWALLQSSVMEEAQSQGLRFQRLQVETGRMEIHGQAQIGRAHV